MGLLILNDDSEGDYCLNYDVLHVRSLVLMNAVKMAPWCWNIVVGMEYEMWFMIGFIAFKLIHFVD